LSLTTRQKHSASLYGSLELIQLGLTEITGLDIDGRLRMVGHTVAGLDNEGLDNEGLDNGVPDIDGWIWAITCNQLKITIERFYQLTGTYKF